MRGWNLYFIIYSVDMQHAHKSQMKHFHEHSWVAQTVKITTNKKWPTNKLRCAKLGLPFCTNFAVEPSIFWSGIHTTRE